MKQTEDVLDDGTPLSAQKRDDMSPRCFSARGQSGESFEQPEIAYFQVELDE